MKITDILQDGKIRLSFEVFPAKEESAFESVRAAAEEIALLSPSFMSVTYGAGGAGGQYTLGLARSLREDRGTTVLAHLTCVSATEETVRTRIAQMKEAGVENVMALRGDLPKEAENADRTGWCYPHASDLIRTLKEQTDFCIGGACYPEVHPESSDRKEDIRHLKEKVDAGCDFLTTQMFFDNDILYGFLYRIREAGITVPVLPGIMPITSAKQIERALKLSGCHMPRRFLSLVDRFGSDPAAMMQAGIAYATDQIIDLFANGITNVHVYSMNKPEVARAIRDNLSEMIGK